MGYKYYYGYGIISVIMALVAIVLALTRNFTVASLHWIASGVFMIAYEIKNKQKHL